MFLKTSFTSLIVGVFVVYVLHTCWVMYGIVYTKPCDNPKGGNCITPFLAGNPKLQVSDVKYDIILCSFVSVGDLVGYDHDVVCLTGCVTHLPPWGKWGNISVSNISLCLSVEYLHRTAAQCRGRTYPDPQGGRLWCQQQVWEVSGTMSL